MAKNMRMICVPGSKINVERPNGVLERPHQHSSIPQCQVKYVMPSGIYSQVSSIN